MVIRVRRLLSHPSLPQGMPTDQSAPEREEGLVNVGPLVVADAKAAKLAEPGKRTFHHPPPSTQSACVLRSGNGEQREDMAGSQIAPDRLGTICAVAYRAVRTTATASSLSLEWWNRKVAPIHRSRYLADEDQPPVGFVTRSKF